MPAAWLERSVETMKIMQSRNVYSKKVQIPKQLHEKFSYLDFEDSKSLFSLDGLLDGSSESRGQAGRRASDPLRAARGLLAAHQPACDARCSRRQQAGCPACRHEGSSRQQVALSGTASRYLRKMRRRRRRASSRLLQSPHPNKVLRNSQRRDRVHHSQHLRQTPLVDVAAETTNQFMVAEMLFATSRPSTSGAVNSARSDQTRERQM